MARGDSTQKKLLKAAINLFHEFGYNGTSVRDIVSAAKVPKGSFYNYFKSKEALAIAASDIFYPYALGFMEQENTSSPVGRLHKYLWLTLAEMQRYGYVRGCLVGNFASEITNARPALKKRALPSFSTKLLVGLPLLFRRPKRLEKLIPEYQRWIFRGSS